MEQKPLICIKCNLEFANFVVFSFHLKLVHVEKEQLQVLLTRNEFIEKKVTKNKPITNLEIVFTKD